MKNTQKSRSSFLESKTKAQTFIGFAIRSGNYKIGANACQTLKRAFLVIACETASDNTKKDAKKLARRFNCPTLITQGISLESITHRPNAKVMAIADEKLAKAIIENKSTEFIEITGE